MTIDQMNLFRSELPPEKLDLLSQGIQPVYKCIPEWKLSKQGNLIVYRCIPDWFCKHFDEPCIKEDYD